ncbi:MAG TPA: hypothetical protein VGL06_24840 [Pseudonocardiaceae bacterium]
MQESAARREDDQGQQQRDGAIDAEQQALAQAAAADGAVVLAGQVDVHVGRDAESRRREQPQHA